MPTLGEFAKPRPTAYLLGIVLTLALASCNRIQQAIDAVTPAKKGPPQPQAQDAAKAAKSTAPNVETAEPKSPALPTPEPAPPSVPPKESVKDLAMQERLAREKSETVTVIRVSHESVRRILRLPDDTSLDWAPVVPEFAPGRASVTVDGSVKAKNVAGAFSGHTYNVGAAREGNLWVPTMITIDRQLVYDVGGAGRMRPIDRAFIVRANQLDPVAKAPVEKAQPRPQPKEVDPAARWRTWTTVDGTTVTAEFQSATAGKIKLRTEDGEPVSLDVKSLSDEDQQWLRKRAR